MATDDLMALDDDPRDDLRDDHGDKPPRSGGLAALAILLALVAVVLSTWAWWEGREGQADPGSNVRDRLDAMQEVVDSQTRDLAALGERVEAAPERGDGVDTAALQRLQAEQRSSVRALQQELETQQSHARALQQAIEALQARLMTAEINLAAKVPVQREGPGQLDLAGVGYLLRLAPERLALYHDIQSADDALAAADAQLAAMDNPMYIGLRQHIAGARQALADTDLPNPVELSARLDAVQARLAGLGFGAKAAAPGDDAGAGEEPQSDPGWWARLKASLGGLVTVRRSTTGAESRLTLDDKDLLRQGLWLQIEGARLALMRHDQQAWDAALKRVGDVLDRWFDASSSDFQSARDEVAALSQVKIAPELPDISAPWTQLRVIREARRPTAPAPAETVQDPETQAEPGEPAPADNTGSDVDEPEIDESDTTESDASEAEGSGPGTTENDATEADASTRDDMA